MSGLLATVEWSRAWEGTANAAGQPRCHCLLGHGLCWPCHTPGDLPRAAGGVCDPALPGRVRGVWTAVGPLWAWGYRSARPEGLVWWSVLPAVSQPRVSWAAAHVQHCCSDQQSPHIPWLMILTNPRHGTIPKCGCILPLLRDMIYRWPWHPVLMVGLFSWVSFPT